jgi:serine/threonine protein phosphatase 1
MKRFVLGDIHGMDEYLKEVLKKCNFDYENDLLIQIGDIVDRGPHPFKCIDELLKIKNKVLIIGNHDAAFLDYVYSGKDSLGTSNGTEITFQEWAKVEIEDQFKYLNDFFKLQKLYHITDDNIMFVHGGFPRDEKLEEVVNHVFYWDRELITQAMSCKGKQKLKTLYDFKEIYVGHTPTIYWGKTIPIYSGGVWNIDTGAGKSGPLTIMDIDTHEYWQSDLSENDINSLKIYGITTKGESQKRKTFQKKEKR